MTDDRYIPGDVGASERVGRDLPTQQPDTSEQAKQEAAATKDEARFQAQATKETAKSEASQVADEAKQQARNVIEEAKSVGRDRLDEQTANMAGMLRTVQQQSEALLDGRTDDAGPLAEYVRQASQAVGRYADRVDELGFEGLIEQTQRFARRRPGMFLLTVAGAGFAVGRLGRGAKDAGPDGGSDGGSRSRTTALDTDDSQHAALPPRARSTDGNGAQDATDVAPPPPPPADRDVAMENRR